MGNQRACLNDCREKRLLGSKFIYYYKLRFLVSCSCYGCVFTNSNNPQ